MLEKPTVEKLLAQYIDPLTGVDLVSAGNVRGVGIDGDKVSVELQLAYPASGLEQELAERVRTHLLADARIASAVVEVGWRVRPHQAQKDLQQHPKIKNITNCTEGNQ